MGRVEVLPVGAYDNGSGQQGIRRVSDARRGWAPRCDHEDIDTIRIVVP